MSRESHVLVVDDDREIAEMTALLLRSAGHRVTLAGSGEEALYLVQEDAPDLVLLDISMPGMNGWEVLRILKEDETTSAIPVVMFSVHFEIREKLRALQQGARDYVTKPFDTDGLLRRVQEILAPAAEQV
ncbi:MAG: response regulator [Acidobacteria bacterium]|nr:response regulator [Acidobacteriota bacterium]